MRATSTERASRADGVRVTSPRFCRASTTRETWLRLSRVLFPFTEGAAQTPAGAAEAVVEALTADRPAFRIQTSPWARDFTGTKLTDQDGAAVLGMTAAWVA
ncbi:hypothetical protein [Streptomyces sp. NPDC090021]|uniref:hypothetical protein n=1 Tax=Streptomyces sp. NPDC090021 TaxID=3365919 RepID=UPI0038086870